MARRGGVSASAVVSDCIGSFPALTDLPSMGRRSRPVPQQVDKAYRSGSTAISNGPRASLEMNLQSDKRTMCHQVDRIVTVAPVLIKDTIAGNSSHIDPPESEILADIGQSLD